MAGTRDGSGQREALLAGAVEHVLRHGVATLSLRPLAAAVGTSDRMLIYYFHSRGELVTAVLGAVGEQLQRELEQALPREPAPPAALLEQAWTVMRSPGVEPHLRLYLEVSGLAVRGLEPYSTAGGAIAEQWMQWIATRLAVPADERAAAAAALLTLLDGLLLVRFVASDDSATRALRWLAPHLHSRE